MILACMSVSAAHLLIPALDSTLEGGVAKAQVLANTWCAAGAKAAGISPGLSRGRHFLIPHQSCSLQAVDATTAQGEKC